MTIDFSADKHCRPGQIRPWCGSLGGAVPLDTNAVLTPESTHAYLQERGSPAHWRMRESSDHGAGGGVELPFGGFKKSGYGREKSIEAFAEYTQTKTVAMKL